MGKYISLEDASYKFCPFIQNQSTSDKCKGPRCMAWREAPDTFTISKGNSIIYMTKQSEVAGYCALIKDGN